MGGTSYSSDTYKAFADSARTKTRDENFASSVNADMLPKDVKIRESRDSDIHPESLAVMISLDVTGSMGRIPEQLIHGKLGEVMETLIKHGILHPQIMFTAVGDHESDRTPFQISQFESGDVELNQWLSKIHIESGGGGNAGESYALPWFFAGMYTSIDCFEKRAQKGFLFTIGDEPFLNEYPAGPFNEERKHGLIDIFGSQASDMTAATMLKLAQKTYHVFHIHVDHGTRILDRGWIDLLGQNVIVINDPEIVAETIASTVAMVRGIELSAITKDFDAATASKVTVALANVKRELTTTGGPRTTAL